MKKIASEKGLCRHPVLYIGVTILVFAGVPPLAEACAVCYGEVESPMTAGMNNGILALLAVIAAVQVGFVALFLSIRQRARQLRQRKNRLQVVQGGAG